MKVLSKTKGGKNPSALAAKIEFYNDRIELIKKFANARR